MSTIDCGAGRRAERYAKWRFRDLIELSAIHGERWDKRLGDPAMSGGKTGGLRTWYMPAVPNPQKFQNQRREREKRGKRM